MKKTLLTIISAITTCLIFTSCFDPIFSDIRNEVPLKEAQISGFINSIVRYKDDIYLQNGRIYFIDRPPSELIPTDTRPLSSTKEAIEQRYNERYSIYTQVSDVRIDARTDAVGVAKMISEDFSK